jgi:drug/metabolite transporter (DMT)-like permease
MIAFFQMYLPLAVYYTINSSTTIFTFALNYYLYKVHITNRQIKAMATAFLGIVLVINGRAIYQFFDSSYEFTTNFDYSSTNLFVQTLMGMLVVVWSCILAYGYVITSRHTATFH